MNAEKIGLGSVQWGAVYGVANSRGQTKLDEVSKILPTALAAGIKLIDTAMHYGDAESVLGQHDLNGFSVVTKTPKFAKTELNKTDAFELIRTFEHSLDKLKSDRIYGLLLHHAEDVLLEGGKYLAEALHELKARGLVSRIGVSIYDSRNLELICERLKPDIVQLPLNVIDQRLIGDGSLRLLKNSGVEIHARSTFLQGLLLMRPSQAPSFFNPWKSVLARWRAACLDQEFSPLEAALSFVIGLDEVDYCIIGVESNKQLEECLSSLSKGRIFDAQGLGCSDVTLVNPVHWMLT